MPTGPDKKFTVKPLTSSAAATATKQTLPTAPAAAKTSPFTEQSVKTAVKGATIRTFGTGQKELTEMVDSRHSVNFTVEALKVAVAGLKELRSTVAQAKKEAIARLRNTEAARMGAEYQQALSNQRADEAARGFPSVWTPFGNVDLPFVKSADPNAPRYDPGEVFAMCLGAETELKKQITTYDATLKRIDQAIRDSEL